MSRTPVAPVDQAAALAQAYEQLFGRPLPTTPPPWDAGLEEAMAVHASRYIDPATDPWGDQ